jgi:hypothetical protein
MESQLPVLLSVMRAFDFAGKVCYCCWVVTFYLADPFVSLPAKVAVLSKPLSSR